ncbi:hypothetical protein CEXT_596701 [Caerostris extrusa]|uniref:Uncharacterized protein n=1 Tax=Caerostris extrusa TaxID=172846 RepID=A0AAV4R709_CAEEX|nr:hypothetical protein CEXT_596701 [Caerostris extrusa]
MRTNTTSRGLEELMLPSLFQLSGRTDHAGPQIRRSGDRPRNCCPGLLSADLRVIIICRKAGTRLLWERRPPDYHGRYWTRKGK